MYFGFGAFSELQKKCAEMHVFWWYLGNEKSLQRSSYFKFLTGEQNPIVYNKTIKDGDIAPWKDLKSFEQR